MRYLPVVLALLALWLSGQAPVAAQTGAGNWSVPTMLFEGEGTIDEPVIVADSTGAAHALWSVQTPSQPNLLYYARWDGTGWTTPVDVISAQSITWPSATVDRGGSLHVVWSGFGDELYYSSVQVADALSPHSWAPPVAMGRAGDRAHIVAQAEGRLHLGFSERGEGGGARYARSTDGGMSWSHDVLIAFPSRPSYMADNVRLAIVPGGTIHAVWTEWDLGADGGAGGVFYARSADDGTSWSSPVQMAGEDYDEINVAVVHGEEVHLAWNGAAGTSGRYHRWSPDGGVTWSDIVLISPPSLGGGSTGPPGLVVDSSGTVHAVVNTSYAAGTEHFTVYASWTGGEWSPLVDISESAPGYAGETNEESEIAVSRGNRLIVLFKDRGGQRVWFTTRRTAAPAVAATSFPGAPARTLTPPPATVSQPIPTPLAPIQGIPREPANRPEGLLDRPLEVVVVSGLLPLAVVAAVVISRVMRRSR